MSEWSIALDRQVDLWRYCQPYRDFEELREKAWELTNLDGEIATPDEIVGDTTLQGLFFQLLKLAPSEVPLYYFTQETSQLIMKARGSYPVDSPALPDRVFFSDTGFWYFSEPLMASSPLDSRNRLFRMLLWHRSRAHRLLTFVGLLDDPVAPLPLIFGTWPDTMTIQKAVDDFSEVSTEHRDDDVAVTSEMMRGLLQTIGASISFCHQHVFLDRREPADRAARRRAEAQGVVVAPDIHVMTLRRAASQPVGESRDVDWQWRWWVRGHWRLQAMGPNRQDRAPVWIMPHVKGPEDRPMKPLVPTIYNVIR